jgi:hypothetical protein
MPVQHPDVQKVIDPLIYIIYCFLNSPLIIYYNYDVADMIKPISDHQHHTCNTGATKQKYV